MRAYFLAAILALVAPLCGHAAQQRTTRDESQVQEPALRRELLEMFEVDQAVRIHAMKAVFKGNAALNVTVDLRDPGTLLTMAAEGFKVTLIDLRNRTRLKDIIETHGWPGRALVGEDGAMAAWLIAQHSDLDLAFQKECLALMQQEPVGDIDRKHIAYLTDRILVAERKKQRYGTQMDNNFEPRPIEDPDNVDQRRAEAGLPSLAEYVRTAKEAYEKMASGATTPSKSGE